MTTLTHLECSLCGRTFVAGKPHNLCQCGGPLLARYDLERAREGYSREWLDHAPTSLWRYAPLLPVANLGSIVSLGEGMTPLVRSRRLGEALGAKNLWIKDDSLNPTGSSEARGMSCAISMAVELNIQRVGLSSGGHAAVALAAYAAAAGIKAQIIMPSNEPHVNLIECMSFGAQLTAVEGLSIEDSAGKMGFDLGALREPYRLEGAKTLGYEIAEQLRWELPDAVLYPTGEGLGLIGIWKAFEEMEAIGWISGKRPKMIAVEGETPRTLAVGLRVSQPLGERLILAVLSASDGTTVAVSDQEMLDAGVRLAAAEGILVAPEGAATLAGLQKLLREGFLGAEERVVILNTASGHKYLGAYSTRFPHSALSEQDKLGGLITPR